MDNGEKPVHKLFTMVEIALMHDGGKAKLVNENAVDHSLPQDTCLRNTL